MADENEEIAEEDNASEGGEEMPLEAEDALPALEPAMIALLMNNPLKGVVQLALQRGSVIRVGQLSLFKVVGIAFESGRALLTALKYAAANAELSEDLEHLVRSRICLFPQSYFISFHFIFFFCSVLQYCRI